MDNHARESIQEFILRVLWYGGSNFDAWLNIAAAKIAGRLLNTPQATAQLGLPSAIVVQLFQVAIGIWTQCIINILYLKYKFNIRHRRTHDSYNHTIQLHEVIGGLLGWKWKIISLIFNLTSLFFISAQQIVACSNFVYLLNDKLNKRTWTMVFAAVFSLSILVPSAHNYRVWAFIGVLTTIFTSGYLTIATLFHGKIPNVRHTSPHSYQDYFTGMSGLTNLGHVIIPVEIMDAMWRPQDYKVVYFYGGGIFILLMVMVPTIIMNINFGDALLTKSNAIVLLPDSKFRDTTIVLMLVHTFINFGMYAIPVYTIWEKMVGVHDSPSYRKRTVFRIPVFLSFWVTALAFPFFGMINRVINSTVVVWNLYIIPCTVYNIVFWSSRERKLTRPFSRLGWEVDLSMNLGIILWVMIVECGLASWGNMNAFLKVKGLKLFASCYSC